MQAFFKSMGISIRCLHRHHSFYVQVLVAATDSLLLVGNKRQDHGAWVLSTKVNLVGATVELVLRAGRREGLVLCDAGVLAADLKGKKEGWSVKNPDKSTCHCSRGLEKLTLMLTLSPASKSVPMDQMPISNLATVPGSIFSCLSCGWKGN